LEGNKLPFVANIVKEEEAEAAESIEKQTKLASEKVSEFLLTQHSFHLTSILMLLPELIGNS